MRSRAAPRVPASGRLAVALLLAALLLIGGCGDRSPEAEEVARLAEELKSPSIQMRRLAAQRMGEIGSAEAVEPLLEALKNDPIDDIRAEAAKALGRIGSPEAVEPLIAVLKAPEAENWSVHHAAVLALGAIGDARAVDAVAAKLSSHEPSVRLAAATALSQLGPRALEALTQAIGDLRHPGWDAAVRGLAASEDEAAMAKVVAVLAEPKLTLEQKAAAAEAVMLNPSPRYTAGVIAIYRNLPGRPRTTEERELVEKTRQNCLHAMGAIGDPESLDILIAEARDDRSHTGQIARNGLAEVARAHPEKVTAALQSGSDSVRRGLVAIVARMDTPASRQALLQATGDRDPQVVVQAVEALTALGEPRAIPPLRQLLARSTAGGRGDDEIAAAAARGLGRLGDRESLPALRALAADKSSPVRGSAIEALGQLKDGESVDLLISVLKECEGDKDPLTAAALTALGRIGDTRATPAVVEVIRRHARYWMYGAAIGALRRLGDPLAVDTLTGIWQREQNRMGDVSEMAQGALVEVADPRSAKAFVERFRTGALSTRQQLARGLVKIGKPAVPHVIAALNDPNLEVRGGLSQVLVQIGKPSIEPLQQFARDLGATGWPQAARALAELGEPEVHKLAAEALATSKRLDARVAAAWILGTGGDQANLEALRKGLADPEPRVRAEVIAAIARLAGADGIALIEPMLKDVHEGVQQIARQKIEEIRSREAAMHRVE